jgi:hypothetical protein
MPRPRHPNKEIEAAVRWAESLGWRFVKGRGHVWGILLCPAAVRAGCRVRVDSTPRTSENHAHYVRRRVGRCPHGLGAAPHVGEEE